MNVLSLFDGMSCGQIALIELGVKIDKYYASEIDKNAISQTQLNFPNTIQVGDVCFLRRAITFKEKTARKLLNSPYISEKTKKKFVYLRNIEWNNIDLLLAGSPCQGFSIAGKQLAFNDPRSKLFFEFIQIYKHLKKLNQNLKFVLENVNMKKIFLRVISDYCEVMPVNINSALVSAQNRERWYWSNIRTRKEGLFSEEHTDIPQPIDKGIMLCDILEDDVPEKYYLSPKCLTGLLNHAKKHKAKGNGFGPSFSDGTGKSNTILARYYKDGSEQLIIQRSHDKNIRRLTPLECSRLQTIPEWYKWNCSDTQIYKMLGNGWTVEVIKHILQYLKQ